MRCGGRYTDWRRGKGVHKYKIDRTTRTLLCKYIHKYDEYVNWLKCERERIISLPASDIDDMPSSTDKADATETAVEKLEKLGTPRTERE